MLSIPGDVIQVIIEFLNYDSISNFYESLGKDSKRNIITFLSRKYKIIDNNNYFSKNKIDDQLWRAVDTVDKGHQEILSMLLKVDGIDVNQVDKYGRTPFYLAARNGSKEIVSMLLEVDSIDVNLAEKDGWTPLWIAAYEGHQDIVSKLLKVLDIDVNQAAKDGRTPLYVAASKGHKEIVLMLLKGKNYNTVDDDGWKMSTKNGKRLNRHWAKANRLWAKEYVNRADKNGFTPLCIAAKNDHDDIVLALMEVEGIIIDGEVIATYCQYRYGYEFLEGPMTKAEADWVKQKKTMAKMLLKARGWILYEWAWYTYDDVLRNLIKDTDIFIMKDTEYVSCKTDIILEATCEALKKQIKASVEYWIEEEHEINKGFWQQELYEIESDLDHAERHLRYDPNNNEKKKKRDYYLSAKNSIIGRRQEVEARLESLKVIDYQVCWFE